MLVVVTLTTGGGDADESRASRIVDAFCSLLSLRGEISRDDSKTRPFFVKKIAHTMFISIFIKGKNH